MIFWNINKLVDELKNGAVTQKSKMIYMLSLIILSLLLGVIPSNGDSEKIKYIESAIEIIGTAIAIITSYNINKNGDNKEYLDRFICLTLPIIIKISVGLVIYYMIYFVLGPIVIGEAFKHYSEKTNSVDIAVDVIIWVAFIMLMNKYIKKAANMNV